MKTTNVLLAGALVVGSAPAFAQSSGNFAASVDGTQCTVNRIDGGLVGGISTEHALLSTTIKTPNSKQTALVITPSLVTGLFTNTLVTESQPSSNQGAAVVVKVKLDGNPVAPATEANEGVIYDERMQQLSTNLFAHIEECRDDNSQTGDEECNIEFALSTLSAHSFNFIAPNVGGGEHDLDVSWEFVCYDGTDADGNGEVDPVPCTTTFVPNSAGACAGPGTVTVQQVKAFSQSGGIDIK